MFLQNNFFPNDEKYEDFIDNLYNKDMLNNKDIDIIHNDYYEKHNEILSFDKKGKVNTSILN